MTLQSLTLHVHTTVRHCTGQRDEQGHRKQLQYALRGLHDVRPHTSHRHALLFAASRASEGAYSTHKHEYSIACAHPTIDTHAP